ncbi:MAG: nucleotidyltransferase family protein [Gammaproteobacteria bacterium]|nr:nucleotidyltransferase family protein [Gammaproteobacteria bacterium]
MIAMILAAGRGERLRPVTNTVPKALVEVRGEKLIDRHLRMLTKAGAENIVINLGWLGEKIVEHVGSGHRYGVQVIYSPEYDNVLETGGGIYRALPVLGSEPFWVVNADIYTDFEIPANKLKNAFAAELVLVDTPAHKPKGDFDLVDGRTVNGPERPLTYSGIARYRPEFFANAGEGRFSVVPMLRDAADAGKLAGTHYGGMWCDVGSPERLEALNRA